MPIFNARPIRFEQKKGKNELAGQFAVSQVEPLPWVVRFSADYLKETAHQFLPEVLGYRLLGWEVGSSVSRYARPWLVWKLLKWFPRLGGVV